MLSRIHKRYIKILFLIILFGSGLYFFRLGFVKYREVSFISKSQPESIVILGNKDLVIENMTIIVRNIYKINQGEKWMGGIIAFNSKNKEIDLYIELPHEIDHVRFINRTKFNFLYTNSSYDVNDDRSFLYINYNSPLNNNNNIRINFDWKIKEKISYDKEKIAILFTNIKVIKPLFSEPVLISVEDGGSWVPVIKNLTMVIDGYHQIDLSLTQPSPTYYYYQTLSFDQSIETKITIVAWIFDSNREISSVQAVFENTILSKKKSGVLFLSGIYVALGVSLIFLSLDKAIDFYFISEKKAIY